MTQEDRNRADARFNKAARAAHDAQSGKTASGTPTPPIMTIGRKTHCPRA